VAVEPVVWVVLTVPVVDVVGAEVLDSVLDVNGTELVGTDVDSVGMLVGTLLEPTESVDSV
jgi:hypothetical protein